MAPGILIDLVDQLFARVDVGTSGTTYWTLTDHLGSIRDVIDTGGVVKDSITYDAYGKITAETNASYRGRYAWTGREIDVETALQYNRARYYDSTTGRWISQDPMGFDAGDSNLYRYVNNAPAISADPSGLMGDGKDSEGVEFFKLATKSPSEENKKEFKALMQQEKLDDVWKQANVRAYFTDKFDSKLDQKAAKAILTEVTDFYLKYGIVINWDIRKLEKQKSDFATFKFYGKSEDAWESFRGIYGKGPAIFFIGRFEPPPANVLIPGAGRGDSRFGANERLAFVAKTPVKGAAKFSYTTAHELGHLFGIQAHTRDLPRNKNDLMLSGLSPNAAATLGQAFLSRDSLEILHFKGNPAPLLPYP